MAKAGTHVGRLLHSCSWHWRRPTTRELHSRRHRLSFPARLSFPVLLSLEISCSFHCQPQQLR